jgi:MerR family transcriptional regulator, light-induced transcriptional regulator
LYTIKRAAELVGVPVAVLRAWQRRYGIVNPVRSDGNYRLYDDDDIAVLQRMRSLVGTGWAPKEAANAILGGSAPSPVGEFGPALDHGDALKPWPPATDLVRAAAALDSTAIGRLLDEHLAAGSFEYVVDGWLLPALEQLGAAWATGAVSVAGEHLVAAAVQRRLSAAFDAAAGVSHPPHVLTGLPQGCRHELGMLAFATAVRRRGVAVTHLGQDLPIEDWAIAADRHRPEAVVLAVPTVDDIAPAVAIATSVADQSRLLGIGGKHQVAAAAAIGARVAHPALTLGHSIATAATTLEAELRRRFG